MKGDRHTMKSLILTTQDARELDKLAKYYQYVVR